MAANVEQSAEKRVKLDKKDIRKSYWLWPVSYTHLDVYKRQLLIGPLVELFDEVILDRSLEQFPAPGGDQKLILFIKDHHRVGDGLLHRCQRILRII